MSSAPILVSGLINVETTLKVDGFPVEYAPVRYPFFGVRSTVSGVGYNVASALKVLGAEPRFMSMTGKDASGAYVRAELAERDIASDWVLPELKETPESAILYDDDGKRAIFTDLKDIQDTSYPAEQFNSALGKSRYCVLCNINFSRPFLKEAKALGRKVVTDVHAISDLFDKYNFDFMAAADILFMSNANIPMPPKEWSRRVTDRFGPKIVVIGLGEHGAFLHDVSRTIHEIVPAPTTRPVVNTIGAGDALLSAFVFFTERGDDSRTALQKAQVFASWKVGERGGAEGFLPADRVEELHAKHF